MSISQIEIKNIKGIEHKCLTLDLMPNKPNLLVASNGFGKSSIATAFSSMNNNRINLREKDCHKENPTLIPELSITIDDQKLIANNTQNDIRKKFDVIVIRSGLEAKAIKQNMGSFTNATASMEIRPITICKIPDKTFFEYNITNIKTAFGKNGKILRNISELLENPLLIRVISSCDLSKFKQERTQSSLENIIQQINNQIGTSEDICEWANNNCLINFSAINPLNDLAKKLTQLGLAQAKIDSFLTAYQIIKIYLADTKSFGLALEWLNYSATKNHYGDLLSDFRSSDWQWASLKEDKKTKILSITFPKAHQLSNGQRDMLTLVTQMNKALYEDSKKPLILLIDEVFDYLDDANLVAFQYYVTSLIESYKERGQTIYPIILTHLDPGVFFDFCFNKHKIKINYLVAKKSTGKSQNTLKLIEARDNNKEIKDRLQKYWFHFCTENSEFESSEWPNNLPREWGNSQTFHKYTADELNRYLEGKNYDSLAVCFAIRIKIEKLLYELLEDEDIKTKFLETYTTRKKIDFALESGIDVPETYFLLGVIYNTNLHWNQERDYISPLTNKLDHSTIKKLIKKITN